MAGIVLVFTRPLAGDSIRSSVEDSTDTATAGVRDWVLANLPPVTALLVPAQLVGDLSRHGHQPDRLIEYGGNRAAPDWRCCRFLITLGDLGVPAARMLPRELAPAYERSRQLAVFSSAHRRAEVREIFAQDAKAARDALVADEAARLEASGALADNPRLDLTPDARITLLAGRVDARVLIALASLTGTHTLAVEGFPVRPGEATTGVPRRAVQITHVDGRRIHPGDSATKDVQRFLMSQVPPYRPEALPISRDGAGRVLTVCFRAPSPIGLLAPVS